MSDQVIAAIIAGAAAIVAALLQRRAAVGPKTRQAAHPVPSPPARPSFAVTVLQGLLLGVVLGAVAFVALCGFLGRPDRYSDKLFALIGGGGVIGTVIGFSRACSR